MDASGAISGPSSTGETRERGVALSDNENTVAICLVTHESAGDLPDCLASIGRLEYRPLELIVVDSASKDESVDAAQHHAPRHLPFKHLPLSDNLGYSGGMNRALQETSAPFVLTLNPDARPKPDFVTGLVNRIHRHPGLRVGAATGRLLKPELAGHPARLDACGMKLVPTWRHLDRGSGQPDTGQWLKPERVFGATGAATLYRREALDDVAIEGEVLASEFHTYREDAELCFRLRERRWEVLYEPKALCEHRRANDPQRRRFMSAEVNFHTLKNRYLLRAYHQDLPNFILTLLPATWRDLLALVYVLSRERSSLPAYGWLWRNRRSISRRRQLIQSRRTCSSGEINRWFWRRSLPL